MTTRRTSLATRIAALTAAAALITALLAGGLAAGLTKRNGQQAAKKTLAKVADAAQATANEAGAAQAGQARARAELQAIKIEVATISVSNVVATRSPLARAALDDADRQTLLAGSSVSRQETISGQQVLIEGRPTRAGALVLVQRLADAAEPSNRAVRLFFLALLAGVSISVCLGLAVAWRVSRPLKRAALAAHALAGGQREVILPVEGPAEVAELAEAVNALASNLNHSESRQRDFLLSVSHDLRTPLTAIGGYAESLADGVVSGEADVRRVGAVMRTESQRLHRLISDLIDLARLDAQTFGIEFGDVNLSEWTRAAAEVWSDRCMANSVRLFVQPPPEWLVVRTDGSRLRQVIDGLMENALRVAPADSTIVLALRPETMPDGSRCAAVEVRDSGPGLTEADIVVAFDRSALYERYRGIRPVGTGLGLAIVRSLTQRLGGTVVAGHAPEGGAQFTVRLPV